MQSIHSFIVRPVGGKRYSNIKEYDGKEFVTSSSLEDHTVTNRLAEVVSLPLIYSGPIKIGDTIVVHHNVFRIYFGMDGLERSSPNFICDDLFFVEKDMVFMYKSEDSDWNATAPYCFVEPATDEDGKNIALYGVLVYKNSDQVNVEVNDQVVFTPDSEYEFRIGDRLLYRMKTHNICLVRDQKY